MKAKVAINGYGTIGKRVADAVSAQKDMEIVGVTKARPNNESRLAVAKGYKLYAALPEKIPDFKKAGIPVEGSLEDLIDKCDIIIDCAPGKAGVLNKDKYYAPKKKKAIFQGGEKAGTAQVSFNAISNYSRSIGKQFVRVVSCNTTGLCRTLHAVEELSPIANARVTLIRRGADPKEIDAGPINAIVPNPVTVPSHHGPDVQTILPQVPITTIAVIVPTTLMHFHSVMVELKNKVTKEQVLEKFEKSPRIRIVSAEDGITSTAEIMELAKELGRNRSDMPEICVWKESVNTQGNELFYMQAVHQESDVVPENVDCIRAMLGLEKDPMKSIRMTDEAMGLKKWW
jgi:glyceraldehyde-3-phosphate dehydrogenase (NAD(P))